MGYNIVEIICASGKRAHNNEYYGKNEDIYMNRKLTAAVLCCVMAVLTACGGKDAKKETGETAAEAVTEEAPAVEVYTPAVHEEGKYYVGIIQQSGHDSLDRASQGFQDELRDLMGDDVEIDYKVADGTELGCDVIIDHFLQDKDDLIMAGGTLALRRAYNATKDVPIVAAGITDFLIAGGVSGVGEPGGNVTGISDLPPMQTQKDFLLNVADGDTIGIVYCSSEVSSGFQVKLIKSYLDDEGADYREYAFTDDSGLESAVTNACGECGTLYLPNDDALARNMGIVKRISLEKGTKVFASNESMCIDGALAAYGIDYYEMGKRTAEMAYDVMIYGIDKADEYNNEDWEADDYEERGDISKISIDRVRDTANAYYNPVIAEKLGWTPNGSYTAVEVEDDAGETAQSGTN